MGITTKFSIGDVVYIPVYSSNNGMIGKEVKKGDIVGIAIDKTDKKTNDYRIRYFFDDGTCGDEEAISADEKTVKSYLKQLSIDELKQEIEANLARNNELSHKMKEIQQGKE